MPAGRGITRGVSAPVIVIVVVIAVVVIVVIIMAPTVVVVVIILVIAGEDEGRGAVIRAQHGRTSGILRRREQGAERGHAERSRQRGRGGEKNERLLHGRVSFRLLRRMWRINLSVS